jgi:hypothetical protein
MNNVSYQIRNKASLNAQIDRRLAIGIMYNMYEGQYQIKKLLIDEAWLSLIGEE